MQKEKYITQTVYSTVKIEENQIVSFNKVDHLSTSFRVYKDGFVGVHYQQGKISDKEGYAIAEKNLELQRPYPFKLEGGKRSRDKKRKILSDAELMAKAKSLRQPIYSCSVSNYTVVPPWNARTQKLSQV